MLYTNPSNIAANIAANVALEIERMGYFQGRVSFARYKVSGRQPGHFGEEHLERLGEHVIGSRNAVTAEGLEAGWVAGEHILDTRFELAKNIVNDTLQFALRIDKLKLPADLLRAYAAIEIQAAAESNPSGFASKRQKREARDAARDRLENEARDGRYLQRKAIPLLWDCQSNELLVGSTAASVAERLVELFPRTFNRKLEPLTAGKQAHALAETREQTRSVDDARPAPFVPAKAASGVAWSPDDAARDFLGNEFLLWLWWVTDQEADAIALGDKSEATLMFARTLLLEDPRGETGRETITSEMPTRLPEAKRAIQAGKLPRKAGLTLVRHDQQYDLTLHAEALAVTGGKLPPLESEEPRAWLEERVTQTRNLIETLDLLYDAFLLRRITSSWSKDLGKMQAWLKRE